MSKDHPVSENNPKGAGRPYHEIDWKLVELPTSSSRTKRANRAALHPEIQGNKVNLFMRNIQLKIEIEIDRYAYCSKS